jgi:antitoxin CcdA
MKLNDLPPSEKKRVNITVSSRLIEEAKSLGINVSQCAEEGVRRKVREAMAAKWLEENREALLAHNEWVKKHGTFGDRVRAWKKKHAAV